MTATSKGQAPVTPPAAVEGVKTTDDPPPAPRRVTRGRMDENHRVRSPEGSPRVGRATNPASLDTSTMDREVQGAVYDPPTDFRIPVNGNLPPPPSWDGPQVVSGQVAHPDDPFVSATLTGSAPAFVPATNNHQSAAPGAGSSSSPGGGSADGGSSNGCLANGGTSNGSSANMSSGRNTSSPSNGQSSESPDPVIVTTPNPGSNGTYAMAYDMPSPIVTRFLRVENVYAGEFDENKPMGMIKALPLFKELVQKLGIFALKPAGGGAQTMLLFVDAWHGARSLHDMLQMTHNVRYITCQAFRAANIMIPETIDRLSAEIDFTVTIKDRSRARRFSKEAVIEMAKGAAARFGVVLHFAIAEDREFAQDGRLRFKIEYNSVADANDAVHVTNPAAGMTLPSGTHEHLLINARGYEPVDVNSPAGQSSETPQTPSARRNGSGSSEVLQYSPTGRTATRTTANGKTAAVAGYVIPSKIPAPSNLPRATLPDSQNTGGRDIYATADPTTEYPMIGPDGLQHQASAKPQDVCEFRILSGQDVRTTLMVRNVPPEMTGADFVNVLQATVPGQFDFAYNRIDFQKSQSVGYAFVNFTGTGALLRFVRMWRGNLLPHNMSRKHLRPCAVSYANTQGFECLVAKFRNSSILDEAKPCRPLLFWSVESAYDRPELIGQEREWPDVDNASKKSRSVENAKISGLYTPRARVNGGRGGRRGGHTRFDRGTTAHQQEENQMSFGNYQHGVGPAPFYGPYAQPRFQGPSMLYDWQTSQLVSSPTAGYPSMPFPTQPMMQASPVQGSALRTHTHGDLGYRHPVMPAQLAPVNNPSGVQVAHQDQFQPLLYPIKGQVPEYYRPV